MMLESKMGWFWRKSKLLLLRNGPGFTHLKGIGLLRLRPFATDKSPWNSTIKGYERKKRILYLIDLFYIGLLGYPAAITSPSILRLNVELSSSSTSISISIFGRFLFNPSRRTQALQIS